MSSITNHCDLPKHVDTIGRVNDPNYACRLAEEIHFHNISECPLYSTIRCNILVDYQIHQVDLPEHGPNSLAVSQNLIRDLE